MAVTPIYAKGFFVMDRSGKTNQLVTFYYYDDEGYYVSLDEEGIKEEMEKLKENMQYFLDQEKIFLNNERVKAKVVDVRIGMLNINYPFVDFVITFKGRIKKGINYYTDEYENEVTEYPYDALWILPGEVIDVKINGEVKVEGNRIFLSVKKGVLTGGTEGFSFVVK